ncbi:hypothetical protein VTL71DRAFT_10866 [Oculimacula yallundae]|uniref:Uncharacterized protein n=1 Tax=Oculimacula yallundae TaxID=86028 RepID=A0ABR4CUL4_9HELO
MAATDIITIILSFLNLGAAIIAVIIAHSSLKALCGNLTDAATILPAYHLPRRPYHPYATGYAHYLRDPYLRPMIEASYRPHHRVLDAGTESSLDRKYMALVHHPTIERSIQEQSGSKSEET